MAVRKLGQGEEVIPQGQSQGGVVRKLGEGEEIIPYGTATGIMNRRIAAGLGGPVDAANSLLGMAGLGSEEPFGGSRLIAKGMQKLGVEVAPENAQPENFGGYVARGVGDTAGAMLPFGAAAKGAAAAPGLLGQIGSTITNTFARSPVTSMLGELVAGAGAGAGGGLAEKVAPGSQTAQVVGQTLGGLAPGAVVGATAVTPTRLAWRAGKAAVVPFTKAGATPRAARRVQELAVDPQKAAAELDKPGIGGLTPAQRTGEPGLMALEREITDASPKAAAKTALQQRNATSALKAALREQGGSVPLADTMAYVGPYSYKKAKADAGKLWDKIDKSVMAPTKRTRAVYMIEKGKLGQAQEEDIPAAARTFLDPDSNRRWAEAESVKELQGLRSKLLESKRAATKAGRSNEARIAGELAEAVLDDMERVQSNADLKAAIAATRGLKEKYVQGGKASLTQPGAGKSWVRQFYDAPLGKEIDAVISSKDPRTFAAEIAREAQSDPTGRAFRGLQAGFIDNLIAKASHGLDTETGEMFLSGSLMRKQLRDPATRAAMEQAFSKEQLGRIEAVGLELYRLEQARGRLPSLRGGVIDDMPSSILSLIVRTAGARSGAKWGRGTSGASLLTAGFFSKRAQTLLEGMTRDRAAELLREAITSNDPKLLQALLLDTSTPQGAKMAGQKLNAWLAGPAFAAFEQD